MWFIKLRIMKKLCFTLSVVGLVMASSLFWSSFFRMKDVNDAIYTTLEGIFMVTSIFCVVLTIDSVLRPSQRILRVKKRL